MKTRWLRKIMSIGLIACASAGWADVTVEFPVTDSVLRHLMTLTLNFTVDGSGNVVLDAETSNGNAAPKAVANAWDGSVGTISDPAFYNTSFTLTGIAKLNNSQVNQLSTDADTFGQGLSVSGERVNGAGTEEIIWTYDGPGSLDFKSASYANRASSADSNLAFHDSDTSNVLMLPSGSTDGTLDLVGSGYSLVSGESFVVTTAQGLDTAAGANFYGFTIDLAVPPSTNLSAITINHPHDPLIHAWRADVLAGSPLDRTGATDVSGLLNTALDELFLMGGGTLYLPAGKYRLDLPIFVPPGTALRGDYVEPSISASVNPAQNTIICAYYGRGLDEQADPLFLLDGSSMVDGLVIWYPEQDVNNIVSYAPSIRHLLQDGTWAVNSSSKNIFLVNAYTGIQLGKEGKGTVIQLMKNIAGTPLSTGIEVWKDADIPRILGVDFNPDYWLAAGLDASPVNQAVLEQHLMNQATGVKYHRCDGSELANINIRGYHKGFSLSDGHTMANGNWLDNEGHYINFTITNCYYAIWIQNIKNHGTQFYNCVLDGVHSAVYVDNPMHGEECAMFMGCELSGGTSALTQSWNAETNDNFSLMFTACSFLSPVNWTGGKLSIADCDFDFSGQHLYVGPDVNRVVVTDSRFQGTRTIDNQAGDKLTLGDPGTKYITPPAYTYDVNKISTYKPPRSETIYISAGGGTNDVPAIQTAIDDLNVRGGGYVVLLPGEYVLASPLVVKANVELRGPVQSWLHSKFLSYYAVQGAVMDTVIYVDYGLNAVDDTVITLEQGAGIDGLFFHYPGQEYSTVTKEVLYEYSWLIRLKGDGAYVKHVTASNPWRFIDVDTFNPKNTYIGYCTGAPLEQGIRVGEADGCAIDNVHFNSWYWNTVYFANKPSAYDPANAYKLELDNWMKANTHAFIFAGSTNLDVYGSFIFCSKQAYTLLPGEVSGQGPSGMVINSGCDWTKFGLYMHANNGLDFVNVHLIDVGKNDPDTTVSSIFVAEDCADEVSFYNLSTWGSSPRTLSMWGTETSRVNLYNFSYQLSLDQDNIIDAGTAHIVNAIRNLSTKSTTVNIDTSARLMLQSFNFPTDLNVVSCQIGNGTVNAGDTNLFMKAGEVDGYLHYYDNAESAIADLTSYTGELKVSWYDSVNGNGPQTGSEASVVGGAYRFLGNTPYNPPSEWVAMLRRGEFVESTVPYIEFSSPAEGSVFRSGDDLLVTANAADFSGVSQVRLWRLYTNAWQLVGDDFDAPFAWNGTTGENDANSNLSNLQEGSYQFKAKVTDNEGQTASTFLNVTVVSNEVPQISGITPEDNAILSYGTNLVVTANVTDDVAIEKVRLRRFYDGVWELVGDDTNAPYEWHGGTGENDPDGRLNTLQPGTYLFEFVATDYEGGVSEITYTITVEEPPVEPIQHLDASVISSITTNASGEVSAWLDLSSNGNNAVDSDGDPVLYPSASLSPTGLAGLDVRTSRASLQLFDTSGMDSFLDFSGSASNNTGFAVLVAFKADQVFANNTRNIVIGNYSTVGSGFQMRFDRGTMGAFINGVRMEKTAELTVAVGDTVIYGFNYTASSGQAVFWDSKNDSELTQTVSAADFSTSNPMRLAGSNNGGQFMDGFIGEVRIFNQSLNAADFEAAKQAMVDTWLQ